MSEDFIKGEVKTLIYDQDDNDFKVGLLRVDDESESLKEYHKRLVKFSGYFAKIITGSLYTLEGSFGLNSKYPETFEVKSFKEELPTNKTAVISLLSSSLFSGIGKSKALKIYNRFKSETIDTILEKPEKLKTIEGLSDKDIETLHNVLSLEKEKSNNILKLNKLGFTTIEALKIVKLSSEEIDKIFLNIYNLYFFIPYFSFKRLDAIGNHNSYKRDDEVRLKAGLIYSLRYEMAEYGHIYFTEEQVLYSLKDVLKINLDDNNLKIKDIINSLIEEGYLIFDKFYFLKSAYEAEKYIALRISNLVKKKKNKAFNNLDYLIKKEEKKNNILYNNEQKEAIKEALNNNFLIITGGPGTGKTLIIKMILNLLLTIYDLKSFHELENDVAVLAPTGRASKRIKELTSFKAMTIHRFLKWNKEDDTFAVKEDNPIRLRLLIIDEASMIDSFLMSSLLKGITPNTKIILVGDYNQLPSVGPGQVLKDLIEGRPSNVIYLKELYRQAQDSMIVNLAYDINNGDVKDIYEGNDLIIKSEGDIIKNVIEIALKYKKLSSFQVLAPIYKTRCGIDNLNKLLQNVFNPLEKAQDSIKIGDVIYRVKDKVLQLVNDFEQNIYNGDIGYIEDISRKEIIINFSGNRVLYGPKEFHDFTLGYAISIHKAQGSEFENVILPISKTYGQMLYKKLYYTGVSRAKKKLYLVGKLDDLKSASLNNRSDKRQTYLLTFLKDYL